VNWPKTRSLSTRIDQVKVAGISPKPTTAIPVSPAGVSPNTQGQPKNLSNVQVTKTSISDTQYQLTVSFDRDPGDPYYTSTQISIQQGTGSSVVVGQGTTSPITVVVNKSQLPTTVICQATGNWGSVPITSSPVKTISLASISAAPDTSTHSGTSSGGTGAGSSFSSITTGTNIKATMTVGPGAAILTSGTGVVEATELATTGTPVKVSGNAPAHAGQHLISQTGNTSALWADPFYLFTQSVASATWTINHNLGKSPAVVVVDSTNREVYGSISFPTSNQCVITFSAPFSGTATLS
jgi:hypothetical protein